MGPTNKLYIKHVMHSVYFSPNPCPEIKEKPNIALVRLMDFGRLRVGAVFSGSRPLQNVQDHAY